jgi:hypothetical protein
MVLDQVVDRVVDAKRVTCRDGVHISRKRTAPKSNRDGVDPNGEHCKWKILSGVYGVSDLALRPFASCSEMFDFEAQGKRARQRWSEDPTYLIKVLSPAKLPRPP